MLRYIYQRTQLFIFSYNRRLRRPVFTQVFVLKWGWPRGQKTSCLPAKKSKSETDVKPWPKTKSLLCIKIVINFALSQAAAFDLLCQYATSTPQFTIIASLILLIKTSWWSWQGGVGYGCVWLAAWTCLAMAMMEKMAMMEMMISAMMTSQWQCWSWQ